ncbi:MAG: hypothetical protein LBJ62_08965 [Bifidobacteriaceae bacterium]|nr:hypothetical protein [Bifidobacteriaceae bacterium]
MLPPGDRDYSPIKDLTLPGVLAAQTAWRAKHLAQGKPLDFQAAPTGDEAGINRGPYKGSRIQARIGQRRGY